jgi:hypothetical protein
MLETHASLETTCHCVGTSNEHCHSFPFDDEMDLHFHLSDDMTHADLMEMSCNCNVLPPPVIFLNVLFFKNICPKFYFKQKSYFCLLVLSYFHWLKYVRLGMTAPKNGSSLLVDRF